ncbi:hypothetical protein RRG08_007271 [Elysia crispata]|uniref:Uncharacterized protein n=1 Tax=Elysia crispata TaxID=231223 RepID=A0AAE1DL98_9GAST|nr:hypothetical protein RRG08_007271 [Elysia crispata]
MITKTLIFFNAVAEHNIESSNELADRQDKESEPKLCISASSVVGIGNQLPPKLSFRHSQKVMLFLLWRSVSLRTQQFNKRSFQVMFSV